MNFTAIDFETANPDPASICAVGLARVEDGKIVDNPPQQLIRPNPLVFKYKHYTENHRITKDHVRAAPTFTEFWPNLIPRMKNPLAAHSAKSVDMKMLMRALDKCGREYPKLEYFCTLEIARKVWPDRGSYGLKEIADFLGITFEHHNAAEDARVCAQIAIEACHLCSVESLHDLYESLGLPVGSLTAIDDSPSGDMAAEIRKGRAFVEIRLPDFSQPPPTRRRHTAPKIRVADIRPSRSGMYPGHPFRGKSFAITGKLDAMEKGDAWQAVVDRGGICHDPIKKDTDFLVVGHFVDYEPDHKSKQMQNAEKWGVPRLSGEDFVRML